LSEFTDADFTGAEFTGERVIPELVNADLLNEHLSRYRFAKHFSGGASPLASILDAGCGSGYGTAELWGTGSVTGTDISAEAIAHARRQYSRPGVRFLQAACEALPFPDAAFDLVVAFEVIEHLDRWGELPAEANRVLKPSGVLLVSTPNRDYYAESRGDAGPNPFHRHEFDYDEFRQLLETVFPYVRIWTQNHAEAIVFSPPNPAAVWLEASGPGDAAQAHFYLAACSQSPITGNSVFAWVPSSANLLDERERHIAKLNGELEKKDAWLERSIEDHSELQRRHEKLTAELESQNSWAAELDREVSDRDTRIDELQKEVVSRLSWIADLESQLGLARTANENLETEQAKRLVWIGDLESQIARARTANEALEAEQAKRLVWIGDLESQITQARAVVERLEVEQRDRLAWVGDLESQIARAQTEIARLHAESAERERQAQSEIDRLRAECADQRAQAQIVIDRLENTVTERTLWAQRLDAEIARYREELREIKSSKWYRAGASLGLGPRPSGGQ